MCTAEVQEQMSHTPAQSWRLARERRQRPGAAVGWTWPGCGAGGGLRGARQFTGSARFSQRSTSFQSSCQTAAVSSGTPARLPGKLAARHNVPRRQLLSSPGTSPRQVGGQCARIRWHTMFPVRRGLGQPCDGRQDGGWAARSGAHGRSTTISTIREQREAAGSRKPSLSGCGTLEQAQN